MSDTPTLAVTTGIAGDAAASTGLSEACSSRQVVRPPTPTMAAQLKTTMRWTRLVGQFGGWVKLGSGCYQAANFSVPVARYASSGVRPASAECGRRAL